MRHAPNRRPRFPPSRERRMGAPSLVRVAERVGRRVATLQANLVWPLVAEVHEEVGIYLDAAVGRCVYLHRPAAYAFRVELLVPSDVQRVGHVDAPSVAADFDHLGAAVQRRAARMRRLAGDAAEMHGAGELRVERVRYVVLPELAGSPARYVQELIVERQVDVGDDRRNRAEALQQAAAGRSGRRVRRPPR